MYLKTLTIKGFKSFASSTTLRLEPGITAVVGPNGSGKSNVVDALTWVMGEQGAKNLRGASMADVIFAGAGNRPALGRAEVSLTIDNTDGALPIEYTEVTITRTLFRGGGSEYQINGTACRLLDVQELLSDTGLGRQMHVIVGQGQLDAILSASPQDRRGFIEEAAGVLKHRRRKERTLRKLEAMAADLNRLKDLTAELRRQLGPLSRQAQVARRARTIQMTVRDAKARLLADDVVQTQAMLQAGAIDAEQLQQRRDQAQAAEQVARARLAELTETQELSAKRLRQATKTWEELTKSAQAFGTLVQVAQERLRSLRPSVPLARGRDPEELERRAQLAQKQQTQLEQELAQARAKLTLATRQRETAEQAENRVGQQLEQLQQRDLAQREEIARATGQVASAQSRYEAALNAVAQAHTALQQAQARELSAQRELTQASDFGAAQSQALSVPAQNETPEQLAQAHQEATNALAAARAAVGAANDARREASAQQAAWEARREALALSLSAQDGTAALADSDLPGVMGALAAQISVERGWENAVAALLGDRANAALLRTDADAVQALTYVQHHSGAALRLAVAESAGLTAAAQALELPGAQVPVPPVPGVRRAGDLVQARQAALAPLIKVLLQAAWVAPDLKTAQTWREKCPDAVVATRAGELLAPGWVSTCGQAASSVLELTAAHAEACARAQAGAQAETQARQALEQARAQEDAARAAVDAALAAWRAADARRAQSAAVLARLTASARAAKAERERAQQVLARAEAESAQCLAQLDAVTATLRQIEQVRAQAEENHEESSAPALAALRLEREQAGRNARAARSAETEARLGLRTAEERLRANSGSAQALQRAARQERQARQEAARAEQRRLARLQLATHLCQQARRAQTAANQWVEQAHMARVELEAGSSRALQLSAQARQDIDRAAQELAQLTDAAHREEVARAQQHMRLQTFAEQALNELGLDLETLVEEYGPHLLVPDLDAAPATDVEGADPQPLNDVAPAPASAPTVQTSPAATPGGHPYVRSEQEKRLARANRDLARLGKVNPLALEEHAALEQRHQFLAEQLADLQRSRADLLRIIAQIDARVLEVFTQAWQDTAREFSAVFARLFPGGQGRLVLTDPQDMLTTGIEIEARPAGKKVKRLSLLSGGERSLAAVALLIAIFKARPSPFYVMDEVEAALDDTNLGRLLDIFVELRQSSQLIIITHQKRTMEIADALYGITMRQGVTQVVSQRLERRQDQA